MIRTLAFTMLTLAISTTAFADNYVMGVGTTYVDPMTSQSNPLDSYVSALTPVGVVNGGTTPLLNSPAFSSASDYRVEVSLIDEDPNDDLFTITRDHFRLPAGFRSTTRSILLY